MEIEDRMSFWKNDGDMLGNGHNLVLLGVVKTSSDFNVFINSLFVTQESRVSKKF